jgi:chemotaxis protein CheX
MSNVKFMNPFIDAAFEVLQAEAAVESQRGALALHKSAFTSNDVTVLITLVGQVQGIVLYSMSTETALALVSKILGQDLVEFDSLSQSGIAELGNVITARATIKLSQAGFSANISPPKLLTGEGEKIAEYDFSRIVVPLESEVGKISIHLALREAPPEPLDQT